MADFFEEFGRMVSDVASDITKKTGDTLEIQKIKSNVRSLKRANERDLADIGRMVYEKFQSGEVSDMDYVTLCEVIEKRDEEIEKQEEEIVKMCHVHEEEGVDRFSIVTSGRALTGEEFDKAIHAYETMKKECKIDLCASMGFVTAEQLHRLHEAGVTSYHHNIETSRRNFPNICTTHTYDMKINTLKMIKAEGMCACSGGIIGMGETWEDRLDMAVSLAELGIDSIPLNALMPIPGTPLEHLERISEDDILRTIAFFRYINPEANIRLGAGRALLTNDGETAFCSGASATITGNMLTTVACATIRSDKKMLKGLGRDVTPEYMKEN